jgi:nucleotide-sensitive chloride channel 1A
MNGDADEYDDDEEGMQGDDDYTPMREIRIFLPEAKCECPHELSQRRKADESPVQSLFSALSQCSALHDSLLPNGEPSSFFGFGDMAEGPDDEDDDEGWEDDMDQTEGDSGVDGGRVRSDFHSGGGPGARFRPY